MAYPYTHEKEVRVLSRHFGEPEARTLEGWKARGGYVALPKAFEMGRDRVIEGSRPPVCGEEVGRGFRPG